MYKIGYQDVQTIMNDIRSYYASHWKQFDDNLITWSNIYDSFNGNY